MNKGSVCIKHRIGFLTDCPSCAAERNYKKDKHTYRQFKKGRRGKR